MMNNSKDIKLFKVGKSTFMLHKDVIAGTHIPREKWVAAIESDAIELHKIITGAVYVKRTKKFRAFIYKFSPVDPAMLGWVGKRAEKFRSIDKVTIYRDSNDKVFSYWYFQEDGTLISNANYGALREDAELYSRRIWDNKERLYKLQLSYKDCLRIYNMLPSGERSHLQQELIRIIELGEKKEWK